MSEKSQVPFKALGIELQELRKERKESLADVAGAVEIDETVMKRIERGLERPNEDILLLLINHFDMIDSEADRLWLMAGYDISEPEEPESMFDDSAAKSMVIMMAMDSRVLYTDQIQISADKNGLIMAFLQNTSGLSGKIQKLPVSRVGMSYDQAGELLTILQKTLAQADYLKQPKSLPAPKHSSKQPNKADKN